MIDEVCKDEYKKNSLIYQLELNADDMKWSKPMPQQAYNKTTPDVKAWHTPVGWT